MWEGEKRAPTVTVTPAGGAMAGNRKGSLELAIVALEVMILNGKNTGSKRRSTQTHLGVFKARIDLR